MTSLWFTRCGVTETRLFAFCYGNGSSTSNNSFRIVLSI